MSNIAFLPGARLMSEKRWENIASQDAFNTLFWCIIRIARLTTGTSQSVSKDAYEGFYRTIASLKDERVITMLLEATHDKVANQPVFYNILALYAYGKYVIPGENLQI